MFDAAPRVLFLTDLLEVGGAETQLVEMLRTLRALPVEADLAVLTPRLDRGLAVALPAPPIEIAWKGPGDLRGWRRLADTVRLGDYDVLCTTHAWSAVSAPGLIRRGPTSKPRRWLAFEHGFRRGAARGLLEPIRRRALRRADRVIAVSRAQGEWIEGAFGVDREKILVLPNAIDTTEGQISSEERATERATWRRRLGLRADSLLTVSVARLVPEKDPITLVEAWARLEAGAARDSHLLLVGDGPDRARVQKRCEALGIAARVHLLGTIRPPRAVLAAADLFALASVSESQGIAVLEAMAASLPVVATDVGGLPEVVVPEETGLLAPSNDPVALGAALSRALLDGAWRVRAGQAGRDRVVRRFDSLLRARLLVEQFA